MARIRYIKPEFFEDEKISKISYQARLLYIGLWCHFLDRNGIGEYNETLFKSKIFPYDKLDIKITVKELLSNRFLTTYTSNDKQYMYCPTFIKHQLFHHTEKPKYNISLDNFNKPVKDPLNNGDITVTTPAGMGNGEWVMGNGNIGSENTSHLADAPVPADPEKKLSLPNGKKLIKEYVWLDKYHELASKNNIPKVKELTQARIKKIKTYSKNGLSFEKFIEVLNEADKSDWLMGRTKERTPFCFDWLFQKGHKDEIENYAKILDGKYSDKKEKTNPLLEKLQREGKGGCSAV